MATKNAHIVGVLTIAALSLSREGETATSSAKARTFYLQAAATFRMMAEHQRGEERAVSLGRAEQNERLAELVG